MKAFKQESKMIWLHFYKNHSCRWVTNRLKRGRMEEQEDELGDFDYNAEWTADRKIVIPNAFCRWQNRLDVGLDEGQGGIEGGS